jgi:pyridinium-3,5-biscarboxylic acid mononucleotide sulfurtransferase
MEGAMENDWVQKKEKLINILNSYNSILVAFSGGVDSTFLIAVTRQIPGKKVIAVTVDTPFFPRRELAAARSISDRLGVAHVVLPLDILTDQNVTANAETRCYDCKKMLNFALRNLADEWEIETLAHGANLDDLGDYRPGLRAASEMGVVAPLIAAGLTKMDIRILSREMGLETWQKPAMACLATRIPYGIRITREALNRVEAAEEVLRTLGFETCRVRHHDHVARIEVAPEAIEAVLKENIRKDIVRLFRKIGYLHISLDLEGYSSGRMNRDIGRQASDPSYRDA